MSRYLVVEDCYDDGYILWEGDSLDKGINEANYFYMCIDDNERNKRRIILVKAEEWWDGNYNPIQFLPTYVVELRREGYDDSTELKCNCIEKAREEAIRETNIVKSLYEKDIWHPVETQVVITKLNDDYCSYEDIEEYEVWSEVN